MLENGQLQVLNMNDILPNRFQPRIHFDEVKLLELADSIRKFGVIQPIVVRQISNKYEIIAGERRFKASELANKTTIPAIVINLSDKDAEEIALLENVQRQSLNAIEEAVSYKRILDMGYISREELSKKIGKPQSLIINKIRLLSLDDEVQNALLKGKISERHARSLLRIINKNDQVNMLHRVINERLTVKRLDDEIAKLLGSSGSQKVLNQSVPNKVEPAVNVNRSDAIILNNERENEKMDIDKIMNEAKDINVAEPPKDVSNFMEQPVQQPTIEGQNTNTQMMNNELNEQPQQPASKFVNFGAVQEPANEIQNVNPTPQAQNNVSFDSIFNQAPISTNQTNTTNNTGSTPAYHTIGSASGLENNTVENNQATVASNDFVNGQPNNVVPEVNSQANIVSNEPINQPQNIVPEAPQNNINSNYTTANQPQAIEPLANITNGMNVNQEIVNQPQVPEVNTQSNVNPNASNIGNIPTVDVIETEDDVQPNIQSAGMQTNVAAVNSENNVSNGNMNFRRAIEIIRRCSQEIEDLGFYIDVDELDLEDKYQVTFKIDKD